MFEVLSKSNTKSDQTWRRQVYASVPSCRHYVRVAQKRLEVVAFDRDTGRQARKLDRIDGSLRLMALDLAMPLDDIYRWTALAEAAPRKRRK